ncbi:mechanosensitive ion channel family protein [Oribacterium sp. P6A1]|uniref:mechanosensitive ion channel family protein n=1 Tax=Oribacterium sp. P6A1 TaxID=1410612 RepID=UPI00068AC4FD|nr:mechanosensitive ion channel domain-containing protein [Oribacterium sp. P6A1]
MFDAEKIMSEFTAIFMQAGSKILLSLVIFIIGRVIIDHIMKLVKKIHAIDRADKTVAGFIISGVKIVLNIVLLLSIINVLGVPMASVITILASAGMAIGLSLQGALSNIAGGIMLLIFRPFNVGEYIQANGVEGTVRAISIMYTTLLTNDNKKIMIPNGELMNKSITNFSSEEFRRVDLQFSTGKGEDVVKVQNILLEVMRNNAKVLTDSPSHMPFASIDGGTNESIIFAARAWVKTGDYWTVYYELLQEITRALGTAGISAPEMKVLVKEN